MYQQHLSLSICLVTSTSLLNQPRFVFSHRHHHHYHCHHYIQAIWGRWSVIAFYCDMPAVKVAARGRRETAKRRFCKELQQIWPQLVTMRNLSQGGASTNMTRGIWPKIVTTRNLSNLNQPEPQQQDTQRVIWELHWGALVGIGHKANAVDSQCWAICHRTSEHIHTNTTNVTSVTMLQYYNVTM